MPDPTDAPGEINSSYDRWDQRPALGRRGLVTMVVVVVLIAAAAFGVVVLVSRGSPTQATAIKVPTSSWIPGQESGNTPISGALAVDGRHCVYLETAVGEVWPVWPAGFQARLDDSGKVSLYDRSDNLVARDGEEVQARGIFTSPAPFAGETCLPSDGEVAVVQSEVTRLG